MGSPTRREFLAMAAGGILAGTARSSRASGGNMMPAEWHPHARCVMAFCAAYGIYTDAEVDAIRREQAAVAKAIAAFEPVTMLANPDDVAAAKALIGPTVSVLPMVHFDVWTRDTLPSLVHDANGHVTAISWNFNVWGEKFSGYYDSDRDLARRFAANQSLPLVTAGIVAEGGAIEVDGEGTLLTSETCLLNANRNPGMSRADVEAELRRHTGAKQVVWLYGSDADEVTDGHVDGIARFIKPGVVVVEVSDDPEDPEFRDLRENAGRLEKARDASGNLMEVIRLLRPRWDVMEERGDEFAASYVNCYLPNGGIVMPRFGDPERDSAARDLFARLMPDRRIVQLAIDQISEGGGGIHCNTQHLPAS